jgi:signal transduction histidine kinase
MRIRDEPEDDRIVVTITDDGAGFDVDAQERERRNGCRAPGHGYGLTDMRRRVDRFGGTLRIDSAPGSGTTVQASLPVHDGDAASDDDRTMRGTTSGTIQVATSGVAIDEVLDGRGSR